MPARKTDQQALSDNSKVMPNGCINWTGCVDKDGYPKIRRRSQRFGMVHLAHRLSYLMVHESIADGLEIDHICRNPTCINPDHLEAVTHELNISRSVRPRENHRNSKKTHCKAGHALSGDNLITEQWQSLTMRKCRACRARRMKERQATMKTLRSCPSCGGNLCEASKICRACYVSGFRRTA